MVREGASSVYNGGPVRGGQKPWLRFTEFNISRLLGTRGAIDESEADLARQRLTLGLAQIRRFSNSAHRCGALFFAKYSNFFAKYSNFDLELLDAPDEPSSPAGLRRDSLKQIDQ